MKDPIEDIANERLVEMAIDIQVQLEKGSGTRPVLWMLLRARARAATALFGLAKVDPAKIEDIRHLQNEVNLYADMIEDCQALVLRGSEADREIHEQDRLEIADLLTPEDAREAGLDQTPED